MVKKHLKSLTVPVTWPIKRKNNVFVIRPNPGKSFELGMPLGLVFRDLLKYCKTSREVSNLLRDKEVLVDGRRRIDQKYLVGLMDVLSIPLSGEHYRMLLNPSNRLHLVKIDAAEASEKLCKIVGKTMISGGKVQLNLFDGRNLLVSEGNYKVGDTLVLKLPGQEISSILNLEKGATVFLFGGKHVGEHGTVLEIKDGLAKIKGKAGEFSTPTDFVVAIGKEKPLIKID
ncbi:MAG: 30S ribosomal protein S4e [Nanoarchaeota archaeon]|nr:30S ribosomal protein S4e [Nanoarchaeota archaeon]